ncbi:MAG: MGMT family protein [Proteobacteria bacterium]|nr:MGMT family protein [Pseudomonadota bacterium]
MSIDSQKLYDLLKEIPQGKVTTYKELAKKLKTKGYRAIGQIVGANPNAPQVPCHRVVRSDGGLGGYAFGLKKKIEILTKEGIKIIDEKVVDFAKKLHKF